MKQNSVFSYVKRNSNNSEGVDGNEQCSSNVEEAPNLKQTKCDSIAKARNGMTRVWDTGSFCQILNEADRFQKCKKRITGSLNFSLLNFCINCLFIEVSNNKKFDFLTSNSCF